MRKSTLLITDDGHSLINGNNIKLEFDSKKELTDYIINHGASAKYFRESVRENITEVRKLVKQHGLDKVVQVHLNNDYDWEYWDILSFIGVDFASYLIMRKEDSYIKDKYLDSVFSEPNNNGKYITIEVYDAGIWFEDLALEFLSNEEREQCKDCENKQLLEKGYTLYIKYLLKHFKKSKNKLK